ncbi:MAG: hypothetical protein M1832_001835 [Thelocarpon impressellum]|nr:MAG: hypothetical protein M1832_001835 [Thelocarpon impressellum]
MSRRDILHHTSATSLDGLENAMTPFRSFVASTPSLASLDKPLPPVPAMSSRTSSVYSDDNLVESSSSSSQDEWAPPDQLYARPLQASSRPSRLPAARHLSEQTGVSRWSTRDLPRPTAVDQTWAASARRETRMPASLAIAREQRPRIDQRSMCGPPAAGSMATAIRSRETSHHGPQAEPLDHRMLPPPLTFRRSVSADRPLSHFSMDSDDEVDEEAAPRGSLLSHLVLPLSRRSSRRPSDGSVGPTPEPETSQRCLFSPPVSSKRPRLDAARKEKRGMQQHFASMYLRRSKQGAATSPIPQGATILTSSARKPYGPDTPHPSKRTPTEPLVSPSHRAVFAVRRGAAQFKLAMQRATRSRAERRREEVRQKIRLVEEE